MQLESVCVSIKMFVNAVAVMERPGNISKIVVAPAALLELEEQP